MTGDQLRCPRVREGVHVVLRSCRISPKTFVDMRERLKEMNDEGTRVKFLLIVSFKRAVGGPAVGRRRGRRLFGEEEEEG